MSRQLLLVFTMLALATMPGAASRKQAPFSVLASYSANVEHDHVEFAEQAVRFFSEMASRDHFQFESTANWEDLNTKRLEHVDVVLWLNDSPHTNQERTAFEQYEERGGRLARISCLGVQRQRYALAMVRSIPWRRRVLWQQLAATTRDTARRRQGKSGHQAPATTICSPCKRVVQLDAQPSRKQRRKGAADT